MKIFSGFENVGSIKNAVVTTGSFDGVHVGHKEILQRLKKLAFETRGETVLITFHPHPRKVLYPDTIGKDLFLINSQREKIELLRKAGLDNLIIVEFTLGFSQITAVDFVKNILLNKIHAKKIVIGFNHHFGHNREGDYSELRDLGLQLEFEVEEIPEQDIHNETVSSTKIRKALLEGNIQKANAYLDHHYIIMGLVKKSNPVLAEIGFPSFSVRIEEESKLIPPNGVYAVTVTDHDHVYKGMCFIKKKGDSSTDAVVEFFLLDEPRELSGDVATVFFHKRLRDEKNLTDPRELKQQLMIDRLQIDELIF
ncbi:MAG: adenylyltransferase/cytidyltransferase family protein [Bacteroidetes bacterium]|nr:adenylyltransferase/cytidyltransferase family protein [Bacteroidota bacterium]